LNFLLETAGVAVMNLIQTVLSPELLEYENRVVIQKTLLDKQLSNELQRSMGPMVASVYAQVSQRDVLDCELWRTF